MLDKVDSLQRNYYKYFQNLKETISKEVIYYDNNHHKNNINEETEILFKKKQNENSLLKSTK